MRPCPYQASGSVVKVTQLVRLLVSVRTYESANSIFLSQQTSTSRAYQPRNKPANRLMIHLLGKDASIKTLIQSLAICL